MNLINHNINQLGELQNLLVQLSVKLYQEPQDVVSGATIGQHVRHILEFYICIEKGIKSGTVSYDDRDRQKEIEEDPSFTINVISELKCFLQAIQNTNIEIEFLANYSLLEDQSCSIKSNLERELAYALDHTIHHMAILKIALKVGDPSIFINNKFGVAPSTLRMRSQLKIYK